MVTVDGQHLCSPFRSIWDLASRGALLSSSTGPCAGVASRVDQASPRRRPDVAPTSPARALARQRREEQPTPGLDLVVVVVLFVVASEQRAEPSPVRRSSETPMLRGQSVEGWRGAGGAAGRGCMSAACDAHTTATPPPPPPLPPPQHSRIPHSSCGSGFLDRRQRCHQFAGGLVDRQEPT